MGEAEEIQTPCHCLQVSALSAPLVTAALPPVASPLTWLRPSSLLQFLRLPALALGSCCLFYLLMPLFQVFQQLTSLHPSGLSASCPPPVTQNIYHLQLQILAD